MKCPWYSRTLDWCNNPERDKCYHYIDFFDHKHGIKQMIMTISDLIALLITILIVVILLIFGVVWKLLDDIKAWQKSIWQELRSIRVNVADTAEYTHNHIAPDVEIISNNFLHLLDESKGLPALVNIVDKMHRNLCVEIADKMVDKVYPPTYNLPCYAPDGICTNPHGDCINCPKRGTGGTWSTGININKED